VVAGAVAVAAGATGVAAAGAAGAAAAGVVAGAAGVATAGAAGAFAPKAADAPETADATGLETGKEEATERPGTANPITSSTTATAIHRSLLETSLTSPIRVPTNPPNLANPFGRS
jgi:hypothetical protein